MSTLVNVTYSKKGDVLGLSDLSKLSHYNLALRWSKEKCLTFRVAFHGNFRVGV